VNEKVTMRVKPNGSIRVVGSVEFVDEQGNVLETKSDFSLCRCGHSADKPFCDGSHRKRNFEAAGN